MVVAGASLVGNQPRNKMDHDYGDDNQQRMFASSSSSASGMAPPLPFPFLPFVASSAVMQATSDIDSLLQVHRRKMLRRAANRRSAQQSRARKKVTFRVKCSTRLLPPHVYILSRP